MKRLHRLILRMLPGPFFGWLGLLMFLLVMQFLIRYLPDLAGKGLPPGVIVELIAYNLAYMVVLAVPMSVLLAALMTFGRLAETNAYAVIKNAGISLPQLLWPAALIALMLTGGMWYFNNEVLPEANFRARNLWQDIRRKQPGFELQAGVFYDGLKGYSILVQHIPPGSNELEDVIVYDYTEGARRRTVVKAAHGRIIPAPSGTSVDLVLEDGEMHRLLEAPSMVDEDRYEWLAFERHRLRLDLSDFVFERSDPNDGFRSDRTMRTAEMIRHVDSLEQTLAAQRRTLMTLSLRLAADSLLAAERDAEPLLPRHRDALVVTNPASFVLAGLDEVQYEQVYASAMQQARNSRAEIDNTRRSLQWAAQRADRYRVEIHKKYSIAVACLIFMLIGAPLGLSIRRGGLGTVGALAVGIFLFYWITLVQGEKLADRGLLTPWVGMWAANIVMALVGLWLLLYVTLDLHATPPLRRRLFGKADK
ncbi:permease [Rhodothermaceae bacterium RA]|nr:permease [Rhodothermaceae bacterium RA]